MGMTATDFEQETTLRDGKKKRSTASFLMCAPLLYDVDYVINPWMEGNVHAASRERAMQQWTQLYASLGEVANVMLVDPEAGWPDMVFTANAGLIRGDEVAISSFFHPERQGEEPHFREWFRQNGYKIINLPRTTPFEGEGDALFAEDGSRLWVGHGPRTSEASHEALRNAWGIEVVGLELVDPRFYHLDTCFAPLAGGHVMYFPAAFSSKGLKAIESFYPEDKRIAIEEADAMRFACNVVCVNETLILNQTSSHLQARLTQLGFEVIQIDLSEFLRAGGAAKCLVMKLRDAAAPARE